MRIAALLVAGLLCTGVAIAQISVKSGKNQVSVGRDNAITVDADVKGANTVATEGNEASVTIGGIGDGVGQQGVTVINDKVWIDGEPVPPGVVRYRAKSGKVYTIRRKNGAVSVSGD